MLDTEKGEDRGRQIIQRRHFVHGQAISIADQKTQGGVQCVLSVAAILHVAVVAGHDNQRLVQIRRYQQTAQERVENSRNSPPRPSDRCGAPAHPWPSGHAAQSCAGRLSATEAHPPPQANRRARLPYLVARASSRLV